MSALSLPLALSLQLNTVMLERIPALDDAFVSIFTEVAFQLSGEEYEGVIKTKL